MKVSTLAKAANVTAETVRYYTREGLLSANRDPNNGYKIYDEVALQRLNFIVQARSLGFSLKEIKEIIDSAMSGNSPCTMVRALLASKIEQTEKEIQVLENKLSLMKKTFSDWQNMSDGTPSEKSVCPLIESVQHNSEASQHDK